jgi:serine-type D-Ala-D-Ala carboxypeptidase/endopeptidase
MHCVLEIVALCVDTTEGRDLGFPMLRFSSFSMANALSVILLATLGPASISFGQSPGVSSESRALIERLGNQFMQRSGSVGLSIGVLIDGQPTFYDFGRIAKGTRDAPDENTIYEIGSISKTMTGTLLARAVIDGKLRLDDDVRKHLDGDYPNLEYAGEPIRIKHLLNHTSGLPYQLPFKREDFQSMSAEKSRVLNQKQQQYSKQDLLDDLHDVKLEAVPGKELSYSSTSAQLLGYILERVYNESFDELLRHKLFSPLAMRRTGITFGDETKNRAEGYNASGEDMPHVPTAFAAAGGISSTASDLLKYAEFHLDESDPAVALSHQPTWGQIEYYAIGLNWQMEQKRDSPRRIWQSGGTGGFSSLLVIYPEAKIGIVILANESDEETQGQLGQLAAKIYTSLTSP